MRVRIKNAHGASGNLTGKNHVSPIIANELVVNWHVTEACNFACRYCFSKWRQDFKGRKIIDDSAASRNLLKEIHHFFDPENYETRKILGLSWKTLRLSLAGGEPLLYRREIVQLAKQARAIGFNLSLITNGSLLTQPLMAELAPLLSMLGLSIDSAQASTNGGIGRTDKYSRVLSLQELPGLIKQGRALNSDLRIKINTVVNALNRTENMMPLIKTLNPDKWKILRMLPAVTNDLEVTDRQFSDFVNRHRGLAKIISIEDNNDMVESYIMLDPQGHFFQNSLYSGGYKYSEPILDAGISAAFKHVQWQNGKFQARYRENRGQEAV